MYMNTVQILLKLNYAFQTSLENWLSGQTGSVINETYLICNIDLTWAMSC